MVSPAARPSVAADSCFGEGSSMLPDVHNSPVMRAFNRIVLALFHLPPVEEPGCIFALMNGRKTYPSQKGISVIQPSTAQPRRRDKCTACAIKSLPKASSNSPVPRVTSSLDYESLIQLQMATGTVERTLH